MAAMDEQATAKRRGGLFCERNIQLGLAMVLFGLAGAVAVAWVQAIRGSKDKKSQNAPLPEAHPIWDSWRAAEKGDVEAYLACFTGAARERLDGEMGSLGRARFKQRLEGESAAADGIQLCPPKASEDSAIIFPVLVRHGDEGDLADYIVVQVGKEWKIRAVVSRGRVHVAPPDDEPTPKQGGKT
jgi:hypothetical protein